MEHSPKFATVKRYYDKGLWTWKQVYNAVRANWITEEEFTEITGQEYVA